MEEFISLGAPCESELVIKRSRFICHLIPVTDLAQAEEAISAVRRENHDARHNCSAMILGPRRDTEKASDDGEPQGTAGIPMLEVLRRSGVTDILAVVTRYFGGILLGAGGLVRAYSGSVVQTLKEASLIANIPARCIRITLPYQDYGKLQNISASFGGSVEAGFGEAVTADITLPAGKADAFLTRMNEALLGALQVEEMSTCLLQRPAGDIL